MNHYHRRLDGKIVNLDIGERLSIPVDFAPPRSWYYKLAAKWRKRIPGFAVSTSVVRGGEYVFVERVA